jgi:cyanophycin synthetase
VQQLPARLRIGLVTAPGDRRDEDIRTLGRLVSGLDRILVKEDDDIRGRQPGDVTRLLVEGLREGGLDASRIETGFSEAAGVQRLLEVLGDGDLGVVLVDDVRAVLDAIQPRTMAAL